MLDTTSIRIVADLMGKMGVEAKSGFTFYLLMQPLQSIIFVIGWCTALVIIGKFITRIVHAASLGCKIRDMLGIGCPGQLTENESNQVIRWVAKNLNQGEKIA